MSKIDSYKIAEGEFIDLWFPSDADRAEFLYEGIAVYGWNEDDFDCFFDAGRGHILRVHKYTWVLGDKE